VKVFWKSTEVAVIGGGIIGLAIAWRAAQRGLTVILLERNEPGSGTSHVAAGMLAPASEADAHQPALVGANLASSRSYPSFVAELGDVYDGEVGYLRCGTLLAARDSDEAQALERELVLREGYGLPVRRVLPTEARRLEPGLTPTVRLALEFSDDHAIDPRRLAAALAAAAVTAGAELCLGAEVVQLDVRQDRVHGVALDDGRVIAADHVVIAAGCWSSAIGGIPPEAQVPLRPVKGQILRMHDPAGPGLLNRVLRMFGGYVVPRGDGRYVLGATMEERGYDTSVTAGAAFELLRDAIELLPGLSELVIEEFGAGLRPAAPDNLPAIGPSSLEGLHWAAGHYRHGVLLAPLTADTVVAGILGEQPCEEATPLSPHRFQPTTLVTRA
jgi:glycine oxidase